MHDNSDNATKIAPGIEAFTFGDPTPVLDRRELLDYIQCLDNGRWYDTPVSFDGLAKTFRSSPHHSSCIYVKRNLLAGSFIPHKLLGRSEFAKLVLDYLIFGNGYLERIDSVGGKPMQLRHALSRYVRRGLKDGQYWWVNGLRTEEEFTRGALWHLIEPDINQEIYGLPEYLGAIQSALLNEASTLFRRRYYLNGSHAGYILYISDAAQNNDDIDAIRAALKDAKGPGNFRNLFLYSPNGKKDGVQMIPISEVAAKDEFLGIKDASRDDVLAAHRVPPPLLGIVPKNAGGFGSIEQAAAVFFRHEIEPLQARLRELNDWLGVEVVRFAPPAPIVSP